MHSDIIERPICIKFSVGCVIPADLFENLISDYAVWKNTETAQVLLRAHISCHCCTFVYGNMKYLCFSFSR